MGYRPMEVDAAQQFDADTADPPVTTPRAGEDPYATHASRAIGSDRTQDGTEERRTRSANDLDDEHTVECEHEHSATYPALDDYVDRQNAEQSDTHGGSFGTSALRA